MDTLVARPPLRTRRFILAGTAAGFAWGIAMRLWMRYIAATPEFTWEGTLFILGAATITGTVLGLAWHRRATGGVGWWRLSLGSLLLLGAGGAVMWPAVVLGAVALGRPWRPWVRVILGVLAAASQIPVVLGIADNWKFGLLEIVLAVTAYVPLLFVEVWAFSVVFRPSPNPAASPVALRVVLGGLTALAVVGIGILVGVAGDM